MNFDSVITDMDQQKIFWAYYYTEYVKHRLFLSANHEMSREEYLKILHDAQLLVGWQTLLQVGAKAQGDLQLLAALEAERDAWETSKLSYH